MVKIYHEEKDGRLLIDMEGHGDLENIDKLDVMCAVNTALINTLALNLESADQMGMLAEPPVLYVGEDGEGIARVSAVPKEEFYGTVKTMFVTVCTGFLYLSVYYPAHVEYNFDIPVNVGGFTPAVDSGKM